jgi:hypothetical protein
MRYQDRERLIVFELTQVSGRDEQDEEVQVAVPKDNEQAIERSSVEAPLVFPPFC